MSKRAFHIELKFTREEVIDELNRQGYRVLKVREPYPSEIVGQEKGKLVVIEDER